MFVDVKIFIIFVEDIYFSKLVLKDILDSVDEDGNGLIDYSEFSILMSPHQTQQTQKL